VPNTTSALKLTLALLLLAPVLFLAAGCDSKDGRDGFEKRCLDSPNGEICDQKYALCIARAATLKPSTATR